jgi:hypothetical protein
MGGCDYFINTQLRIITTLSEEYEVELRYERGYFGSIRHRCDSDDENYETEFKKHIEKCLIPDKQPIMIYSSGTFLNENAKNKYESCILSELQYWGLTLNDVVSIYKEQTRTKCG